MYIASHSKQTEEERSLIFNEIIIPKMMACEETKNYFSNHEFLKMFGCDIKLELGKEPICHKLLTQCESYIPEQVIKKYSNYLPSKSDDENYIGILNKKQLWFYIQNLQKSKLETFKNEYDACKNNPQYATEYGIKHLAECCISYQKSIQTETPNKMPFIIKTSFEYFLYQLYDLYQKTNFETTDLLLYGW